MPKEKKTQISRLRSFILEFGDNVFSADGRILFCKICEIKVEYERRSSVIPTTYKNSKTCEND